MDGSQSQPEASEQRRADEIGAMAAEQVWAFFSATLPPPPSRSTTGLAASSAANRAVLLFIAVFSSRDRLNHVTA